MHDLSDPHKGTGHSAQCQALIVYVLPYRQAPSCDHRPDLKPEACNLRWPQLPVVWA